MKKNDWILLISVLAYSYLFYQQAAGINFLIFNLIVVTGAVLKSPEAYKNKNWLMAAAGALVSAIFIMVYSSPLAIVTSIFSLGILSVMSFSPDTSVVLSLILTLCSVGSSFVFMFIDMIRRKKNSAEKGTQAAVLCKGINGFCCVGDYCFVFPDVSNLQPFV